jgi:Protein of unknown function (DUF3099)
VICLIVGMFVQGWFMWVCFAGAIFLPYFAVILANANSSGNTPKGQGVIEAPTLAIGADAFREAGKK